MGKPLGFVDKEMEGSEDEDQDDEEDDSHDD